MKIQPKNWEELQHYKDRSPVWIKLHRKLLDNYDYHRLPVASKAIAPLLWLLASEYKNGIIDDSEEAISFRLRLSVKSFNEALKPLITSEFFTEFDNAITALAESERLAILEKRREEERQRREREKKKIVDFEKFWDVFGYKKGRGGAEKSWGNISLDEYNDELLEHIIRGAEKEALRRPSILARGHTPKMAQGWLTEKRWMDDIPINEPIPIKTAHQLKDERSRAGMAAHARSMGYDVSDIFARDGISPVGNRNGDERKADGGVLGIAATPTR